MNDAYAHLYGPVPSRRLGRSLGVDIVPFKVCTYNCVYCQLGRTDATTRKRDAYISADEILSEVERKVNEPGFQADYLTLGGSGEPTLHSGLADIIAGIKNITTVPVAVITNGSLMDDPDVRKAVLGADLIMPSLDAPTAEIFARINRPDADVSFDSMVQGLTDLRNEFTGLIWLEVFFINGYNTSDEDLEAFQALFARLQPDKIHINTAVRPPAETDIAPLDAAALQRIKAILGDDAEIIVSVQTDSPQPAGTVTAESVLAYLERRPGSLADLAKGLNAEKEVLSALLAKLVDDGQAIGNKRRTETIYQAAERSGDHSYNNRSYRSH